MATRVIKSGIICAVGVGVLAGTWYFPAAVSTHDTPSLSTDESFQQAEVEGLAPDLSDLLRLPPHLHPDAVVGQAADVSVPEAVADAPDQGETAVGADDTEQSPEQPVALKAPTVASNKPFLAALGGGIAGTEPLTGVHRPASSMKRSSPSNPAESNLPEDAEATVADATDKDAPAAAEEQDPQEQHAENAGCGEQSEESAASVEEDAGELAVVDTCDQTPSTDAGAGVASSGDGSEPDSTSAPEADVTDAGEPVPEDAIPPIVALDDPLSDSNPDQNGVAGSPAAQPDQEEGSTLDQGNNSDQGNNPDQGSNPQVSGGPSLGDPFSVVPPADIIVLGDEFTQKPTPTPAPEQQLPDNPGAPVGKADPASTTEGGEPEDVEVVAVPEPTSLGAMLLGMAGLVWLRRKRAR